MKIGTVSQTRLAEMKRQIEHLLGVEILAMEHTASRWHGRECFFPRPALVRVDWRKGDESGWQFVEAECDEIEP